MDPSPDFVARCPLPLGHHPNILLAHGGGGRLTQQLIDGVFGPAFANPALDERHDGACLALGGQRLAFSTDSYVVRPLFFPGSDIGALAVNGTVNDLAMCGARPLALSCGLILEEGLAMATLQRIVDQFPGLAVAQVAQQRIEILRLELKGKEKSQVVKLGSYEKDIGLKNPPRA